ncbi:N-acetyl-gamma-glutamyl-phosphate reductase [Anaerotignum sp. MB30-C6]|uniref:N-acetyl-gamma-glutamyl-phosphate reductase n=1 Tax=Anaerotignum sp. MB30-C6 TaxID=3070814 RepID=UPI0027DBB008|nr:N-acetyl-gamma-glutamyl-phosphate reductase [Anaerotignum sp. MB30-C6]WMI81188.1 N-acetyl-gamma-glutamyl-phosphate reductase [Anaerotignum sp. MB30-C6]
MKYKVYIDGQAGTTGLQLRQRLEHHPNIELLLISEELRKDEAERKRLINRSDVVFLCLPDEAAKEAVKLVENPNVCIIDASTAHRTNPLWTYGFPELSQEHRQEIAVSKRIANPGCHATGFIAGAYPLVKLGIISPDYPFSAHSITGYSGGGKGMIQEYEETHRPLAYESPRQYGLSQTHKHLPEMQYVTGISAPPVLSPIVCDFYCGMETCIPLHSNLFLKKVTKAELTELLKDFYKDSSFITFAQEETGFLASNTMANNNGLTLYLEGNDERMTLISVFDNLGKGASGAAVQNMNIVLGLNETQGLE